jgi:hypothetical protein
MKSSIPKKQSPKSKDKPATKKVLKSQGVFLPRKSSASPSGGTDSTTIARRKSVLSGSNAGQDS